MNKLFALIYIFLLTNIIIKKHTWINIYVLSPIHGNFVIKNFNHLHHNAIEKQEEENNENFFTSKEGSSNASS